MSVARIIVILFVICLIIITTQTIVFWTFFHRRFRYLSEYQTSCIIPIDPRHVVMKYLLNICL